MSLPLATNSVQHVLLLECNATCSCVTNSIAMLAVSQMTVSTLKIMPQNVEWAEVAPGSVHATGRSSSSS